METWPIQLQYQLLGLRKERERGKVVSGNRNMHTLQRLGQQIKGWALDTTVSGLYIRNRVNNVWIVFHFFSSVLLHRDPPALHLHTGCAVGRALKTAQ